MKSKHVYNMNGSITVFLSLTFLLILAFVMTMIESARINTSKVYINRSLQAAMNSILAEYYYPLYHEYHIFALDSGYGTETMNKDLMVSKLDEYMNYTFEPEKDLNLLGYIPVKNTNFFNIQTSDIQIENANTLLDFNGELFFNQAVSYMKYRVAGDGLEAFLEKLNIVKDTEKVQPILSKKQETEESLVKIDEKILKLMMYIDGISMNEDGVKIDKKGNLVITDYFVKKLCTLPPNQEFLGINNDMAFSSLKDQYVQPLQIIDFAKADIDSLLINIDYKEEAWKEYKKLCEIDQSKIKDDNELNKLKEAIKTSELKLNYHLNFEARMINSFRSRIKKLNAINDGTLDSIHMALQTIDEITLEKELVTDKIQDYEKLLSENKDMISKGIYDGLMEDYKSLEKYKTNVNGTSSSTDYYDFEGMKETLYSNRDILTQLNTYKGLGASDSETQLYEAKEKLTNMYNIYLSYSHQKLNFDYSSLKKPVESESFFDSIKTLIEDGILGLIIEDIETISDKSINISDLPTNLFGVDVDQDSSDLTTIVSNLNLKNAKSPLQDTLLEGDKILGKNKLITTADTIGQYLLFQEYLLNHFQSYKQEEAEDTIKALDYELEYIIMGKSTDYDNLKSIIMRIILIRTILNLVTLFSDHKSNGEARNLALGFVGFTGLTALVSIVKTIIITIWAFEEALVDVSALINGKTVPLLKMGGDLCLNINELASFSKSLIKEKVNSMKENTVKINFNYEDYLKLFLFIEGQKKKSLRALDIIQENLQIKYEDTFYIKNCTYGFRVNATFEIPYKFIMLPFVKKMNDTSNEHYVYQTVQEYSY